MNPLLEMRAIEKSFFGVRVLRGVNLDLLPGEVHAFLGANGAGKSTLIKILSGAYTLDSGDILLDGKRIDMARHTPQAALELGIATIYQNFHLIPHLTVAENICLADMATGDSRLVDWGGMRRKASEALAAIGPGIAPGQTTKDLTVSQRQMLEIAIALSRKARIIIMDEPTAAISHKETEVLFDLTNTIKKTGVGIIYISHRLEEIQRIADRVSVLRDGMNIGTMPAGDTLDIAKVIEMIAGREVASGRRRRETRTDAAPPVMTVDRLRVPGFDREVSFALKAGEVLGLTGLVGAGKTELGRALFGVDKPLGGTVTVAGRTVAPGSPDDAIRAGLGYLPEDRDNSGLCLSMPLKDNITLTSLAKAARAVFSVRKETRAAERYRRGLAIKSTGVDQQVRYLSGGNKQKVIFAKWFEADCRVLVLDEPTIGIDVGAREDIYRLIGEFVSSGRAVLLISSDLDEALSQSDRVMVMTGGAIRTTLDADRTDKREIMAHCLEATDREK
jgi:ribose transport system ATP-binding protein